MAITKLEGEAKAVNVKGSAMWLAWLEAFARARSVTRQQLVVEALRAFARQQRYPAPPPRTEG